MPPIESERRKQRRRRRQRRTEDEDVVMSEPEEEDDVIMHDAESSAGVAIKTSIFAASKARHSHSDVQVKKPKGLEHSSVHAQLGKMFSSSSESETPSTLMTTPPFLVHHFARCHRLRLFVFRIIGPIRFVLQIVVNIFEIRV
ncbi:hypothetical protein B0H14DRAFT_3510045 [Mycena olivaceomarginata]|nr:hypothetical protein B0H14DRAFT_3510045 [Mycena olivaceomarginata]